MKKLLILGANHETVPLVQCATQLGIEVYVADPNVDAPAKAFAQHAVNIDATNVEMLYRFALDNKIDAVMVGVAHRLIASYSKLCQKLEFCAYCRPDVAQIWSNKALSNDLLDQCGIRSIPSIVVSKPEKDLSIPFEYPCLIKPTDGSAGKGITIAYKASDLLGGIDKALAASHERCALVEKYMTGDDLFVYCSLFSGELSIVATADRFTTALGSDKSKVCFAARYPSRHQKELVQNYQIKLAMACDKSGLDNGVLMLSAFVEAGNFYFYDPGIRLQGEAPDVHVLNETGKDHKKALIDLAFSNLTSEVDLFPDGVIYTDNDFGTTLWILISSGEISQITGIENIKNHPNVFETRQRFNEGDLVKADTIGTEGQVFLRIYAKLSSNAELLGLIEIIRQQVHVLDIYGKEMIVDVPYEELLT